MLKLAIGAMTAWVDVCHANPAAADADTRDIVDTVVAAGSFKTMAKAPVAADLVQTLESCDAP